MDIEVKNGIRAFLVIGVYFLIIEFLNVKHTAFLRVLNILIVGVFVNKSILNGIREKRSFLSVFGSAFFTNLVAVVLSTIALAIYITLIKGESQIGLLAQPLLSIGSGQLNTAQFSFAIFAEGFASGVILSFGMMQFWKNRTQNLKLS